VFNAANEQCVAAFVNGGLPFLGVVETVRAVVEDYEFPGAVELEAVEDAERWARARADAIIASR